MYTRREFLVTGTAATLGAASLAAQSSEPAP